VAIGLDMKLIATFRVNAGLRHNVPAASAIVYSIGDSVYTYSEMPGVWTGTHRVVADVAKEEANTWLKATNEINIAPTSTRLAFPSNPTTR
jgi:hypothetical protein